MIFVEVIYKINLNDIYGEKAMQIHSRKISIIGVLAFILFLFLIILTINFFDFFKKNEVEALSQEIIENQELNINKHPINIDEVLHKNAINDEKWEMSHEEIDLEYNTTYTENPDLPSGTMHVTQVRNRWCSRNYYSKKICRK